MKFSKYDLESGTNIEVEVHNYSTLNEVIKEFENFLRCCGYVIEYNQVLTIEEIDQ